jgi:hypothetical protein
VPGEVGSVDAYWHWLTGAHKPAQWLRIPLGRLCVTACSWIRTMATSTGSRSAPAFCLCEILRVHDGASASPDSYPYWNGQLLERNPPPVDVVK